MKTIILTAALLVAAAPPALAQHGGHHQHQSQQPPLQHQHAAPAAGPHAGHGPAAVHDHAAPETEAGPANAADRYFDPAAMARARETLRQEQGAMQTYRVLVDRLETRMREGEDGYAWDAEAWYGGDIDKLKFKTEGEGGYSDRIDAVEVRALWSHAIDPWFDLQAGARHDFRPGRDDRSHLVLGVEGLAPYYIEVDAAAFLSQHGELTARLEAEYDQLITQRLVLQPRAEAELSARDIREAGIGKGLSSVEAGLRLRYEIVPELAPYIGVQYERRIGNAADFARADGEDAGSWVGLAGLRLWF